MNKFFSYYSSLCVGANTPTIFASDPYIIAIKEMLLAELQKIVYYIEKLRDFNIDMSEYTDKVIEFISILIVNLDFRKESFFTIIRDLYINKKMLEKLYISSCEKNSKQQELLSDDDNDYSSLELVLKVLNEHEKNIIINKEFFSKDKKNLYEIMINLVLNACNCLIELKNYGVNFVEAKYEVLTLLNTSNIPSITKEKWIEKIRDFSAFNYKIMQLLYSAIMEHFGSIHKKSVCVCKKKGKSILVSGNSLLDLEKLLNALKDLDINVYTHSEMINAFKYEKFQNYPNLTGHYQSAANNFHLDFASFPGAIYITGDSMPKIDVIRGQIYTSKKYPSFGISKIENYDFSPIIEYTNDTKGFSNNENDDFIYVGYSKDDILKMVDLISEKINYNQISNIIFIGTMDRFNKHDKYIIDFLNECNQDTFVISFAYDKKCENFWHVCSCYDFYLVYEIIKLLKEKCRNIAANIHMILSDCDSQTISHIFNLFYLGIKNIYLGSCCPNIINPILLGGLNTLFNVHSLSQPKDDIINITEKKEEV